MIRKWDTSTAETDSAPAESAVRQLPLHLSPPAGRRFDNFETVPENSELVVAVRRVAAEEARERVLIVGDVGTGKSHLLQAANQLASTGGNAVAFIPMRHWRSLHVDAIRGLGRSGLLCIDDVDAVAGDCAWEEALLALFEEAVSWRARMLLSARASPSSTPFALADVRSRLSAATLYRLRELDDEGRARALRRHARERGIEIPDDVVSYVLKRHRRDMPSLVALLDRFDRHSMARQRRLTVPFVRELIEAGRERRESTN